MTDMAKKKKKKKKKEKEICIHVDVAVAVSELGASPCAAYTMITAPTHTQI